MLKRLSLILFTTVCLSVVAFAQDPGQCVITLTNEDAASTAANRFKRAAGNYGIPVDECVGISYDGTASRWRIVN